MIGIFGLALISLRRQRVGRRRSSLAPRVVVAIGLCAMLTGTAPAGHVPEVSQRLSGKAVPDAEAVTLDGKRVSLADFRGKPLIISLFASWCPPCQATVRSFRELVPDYLQQGVNVIGVLADAVETPDTVADAKKQLERNPLPYPVVLLNPALKAALSYEGFPATYFVTAGGTFTTTLFGLQPPEKIREVADSLLPHSAAQGTTHAANGNPTSAEPGHRSWKQPLAPLVPQRWKQWHPLVVHFPTALLLMETLVLLAGCVRPSEKLARLSGWLLLWAAVSLLPVILAGINDAGLDVGTGWPFWNGLQDRVHNIVRLESAVSLHVLYALATALLVMGRGVWRWRAGPRAAQGRQRFAFAIAALLGLWLLFAAGQVGGGISHS